MLLYLLAHIPFFSSVPPPAFLPWPVERVRHKQLRSHWSRRHLFLRAHWSKWQNPSVTASKACARPQILNNTTILSDVIFQQKTSIVGCKIDQKQKKHGIGCFSRDPLTLEFNQKTKKWKELQVFRDQWPMVNEDYKTQVDETRWYHDDDGDDFLQ